MNSLLSAYIKDLKVEGIKLQLQLCSPHEKIQRNEIIGNINFKELDSYVAITIIRGAIEQMEMVSSYEELFDLFEKWGKERLTIQYQGYYFDPKRRTEAYCYVFMARILRKRHKELKKLIGK